MLPLERKFIAEIKKIFIFENNPRVAVGVSGGPDSIALTFLLKKWIKSKKGELTALIIDHQIRNNSSKEAISVKKYLEKNNIKNIILKVSKRKVLEGKMQQARENRFEKMQHYCNKNGIFHLFIAHHFDDNIETFLLRKIAGSNFEGLNCMQKNILFNKVKIIRPLLSFTKKQLINYNKKMKLEYFEDPSNKDRKYSRVVVRNFINKNNNLLKNTKMEFKIIQNNFKNYKAMVFHLFNLLTISIYKKSILIDSKNFFHLDLELQVKIIETIYKFFYPKFPFLRYKKIILFLSRISNEEIILTNLSKLSISRRNNLLKFSKVT